MWERATDRFVRQEKLAGQNIRVLRFAAGTERAVDRHARRRPRAPGRREPGLHPVHPRRLRCRQPRRRSDLRAPRRRQGPAVGGHRPRPRPAGRGQREVHPLRNGRRRLLEPQRQQGARPPRGRPGGLVGGHLQRRPEPAGRRSRDASSASATTRTCPAASPTTRCARSSGRGRPALGGHGRRPRPVRSERSAPSPTTGATRASRRAWPTITCSPWPRTAAACCGWGRGWAASTSGIPLSWQFGHVAPDPQSSRPALGSGHVTSFSEDRAGRLWIGTFDAGLYVMDRTTGEMTAVPARSEERPQPGQRPGDGAAPRSPRRPLDRHPGCGPQPPRHALRASSSTIAPGPSRPRA